MKYTDTKHVATAINNAAEQFAKAKIYEEKYNFFQLWLTLVADAASQPSNSMEKRNEQLIKNTENALNQMEQDLGKIVDVPSKIDMLNVIYTSINTPYGKGESVDKAINNISGVIKKYGEKIKEEASEHNKKVESEKLQQQSAEINDELYKQAGNIDGKVNAISSAINVKHNSQLPVNEIKIQKETLTEKTENYTEEAHKNLFLDSVYQGVKESGNPNGEFDTIVADAEKVVQKQIVKELEEKKKKELDERKNKLEKEYTNQIEEFKEQIEKNKNNPEKTKSLLNNQLNAKLGIELAQSFIRELKDITKEEQIGEKAQKQLEEKEKFAEVIKIAFPQNNLGKEKFVEAMFVYLDKDGFNQSLVESVAENVGRESEAYGKVKEKVKEEIDKLEKNRKNISDKVGNKQKMFANKNNAPKDRADAFVELLTAKNNIIDNTKEIENKTTKLVEQEQKINKLVDSNYQAQNQKVENKVQQPPFDTKGITDKVNGLFFNFAKNHVLDKMGEAYEKNKNNSQKLNEALDEIKGGY